MAHKYFFCCLLGCLAPLYAGAQIVLDASDVPPFGAVLITKTDTLAAGFEPGPGGEAVTWDFTLLAGDQSDTSTVVDPAATPFSGLFPEATFAFVNNVGFYSFAQVTAEALFALGGTAALPGGGSLTAALDPPQQLLAVPSAFGTSFTDTFGLQVEIDGAIINPFIDSIRLVQTNLQEARIDAYGTLELPEGTYEALRQRVETYTVDSIFVKFFGAWSLFDASQDTSLRYEWWAAEGRGIVLSLDVDAEGNALSATYLASYEAGTTVAAPVAAFSVEILGEGEVAFADASTNSPTQWLWDFGDGSTSEEESPVHTYEASGEYEVCLTASNAGGENTACQEISVMVTSTRQARMVVEGLRAYPSPVADRLYLEFSTLAGQPVQLHLINTLGQNFGTYRLDFAPAEPWGLDVAALPPGLYRLAVASGNRHAQTLTFLRQP